MRLRAWFIGHFNLTPFELSINSWSINLYVRLFYLVLELEISTGKMERIERREKSTLELCQNKEETEEGKEVNA